MYKCAYCRYKNHFMKKLQSTKLTNSRGNEHSNKVDMQYSIKSFL